MAELRPALGAAYRIRGAKSCPDILVRLVREDVEHESTYRFVLRVEQASGLPGGYLEEAWFRVRGSLGTREGGVALDRDAGGLPGQLRWEVCQ